MQNEESDKKDKSNKKMKINVYKRKSYKAVVRKIPQFMTEA